MNQTQSQFNQAVGAVTVDSEVVLARNEYPTLKERLDAELADIENIQLPLKANKLQEAWITPTLSNGYTSHPSYPEVAYRKNDRSRKG